MHYTKLLLFLLIVPRGASFRISPTSTSNQHLNTDTLLNGDEPVSTLTQDFHTRLDNLLRTLVHAKPHFVRCIGKPKRPDQVAARSPNLGLIQTSQILKFEARLFSETFSQAVLGFGLEISNFDLF